ncbi:ABC transporter permease [Streptococcus intermedius]|uniref:ABC transporter permease n=1 Tax=Streptococcus intermedius TaxID=1338 RepID=UPI000F659FFD|nr:ABC transporter permease [Streptococcus intermedius]RSJ16647.1 ABC-2 type transporter [Streptococcus intermedius]
MLLAIIRRNWQMYKRYFPITLFFNRVLDAGFSLLSLWLIANFLFANKFKVGHTLEYSDYFSYAAVGLVYYNASVAIMMNVGRALITEVREGTLESTLVSPFNIIYYYLGTFFEQFGRTFLEFLSSYLIAVLLGANLQKISLWDLLICFFYISICSFSMGVFLSNIMLWFRDTFISQNTIFLVIFLVSGITFPTEVLPEFLKLISNFIPLTYSIRAIRTLYLHDIQTSIINFSFIEGLLISILYFMIGIFVYKKVEKKIVSDVSY